jgi:hypothetical protein
MPVREQVTSQIILVAGINLALDDNETNAGVIVDTANFDLGLYFAPILTAWTDGDHTLLIEEGSDSGLSDATTVGAEKLVGDIPILSAINANGDILECVGVHSTKRYVRASFVSTGVTTGAVGTIQAVKGAENCRSTSTEGFDV